MNFVSNQFQPKPLPSPGNGSKSLPKIQTPEEKALIQAKTRKLNAEAAKDRAIEFQIYGSSHSAPNKSKR